MFKFQQFSIDDSRCGMKLGTDSVALGAWVDARGCRRALDAGAGSGILALMLAQRFPQLRIDAVEIDSGASADCLANFEASPWTDRLTLTTDDFGTLGHPSHYDLIVSNPPYFSSSLKAPDASRATARHEGALNYRSLIEFGASTLPPDGSLAMVLPAELADDCIYHGTLRRLYIRRLAWLAHRSGQQPKRVLLQMSPTDGPCEKSTLIVQSDEFRQLTADFYLVK